MSCHVINDLNKIIRSTSFFYTETKLRMGRGGDVLFCSPSPVDHVHVVCLLRKKQIKIKGSRPRGSSLEILEEQLHRQWPKRYAHSASDW
jgi:hypothetical protein